MNVKGIWFFVIFVIPMSLSERLKELNVQGAPLNEADISWFEKNCHDLTKNIRDNNITKYTVDCPDSAVNSRKITEESVLQYACFLVKKILRFLCVNRKPIKADSLNFVKDNKTAICPLNFSKLKNLTIPFNDKMEKELTDSGHCSQVCYDLYYPKSQCIILYNVNLFLNSVDFQKTVSQNIREGMPAESQMPPIVPYKAENQNLAAERGSVIEQTEKLKKNETVRQDTKVGEKSQIQILPSEKKTESMIEEKKEINALEKKFEEQLKKDDPIKQVSNPKEISSTDFMLNTAKNEIFSSPENEELRPPKIDDRDPEYEVDEDPEIGASKSFQKSNNFEENLGKLEKDPTDQNEIFSGEGFFQAEDSHFFFYFLMFSTVVVIGYLAFHNKNKILAYAIEGSSGRRNRRRPNPARYRKLESNLEEAMSSGISQAATSSVVY